MYKAVLSPGLIPGTKPPYFLRLSAVSVGLKVIEKRSDDELNTILKRYDKYMETTRPVLDFYSKNPKFNEIDGTLKIEEITAKIDAFLNV